MRLLDQVVQAVHPVEIEDMAGVHRMAGPVERADAVRACPIRWVLQPNVAQRCRTLLQSDRPMLAAENLHLRAPAPRCWIEWMEWGEGRTGLLVQSDEQGRSGSIEVFWEQPTGEPELAQARLDFDFDAPIGGTGVFLDADAHPLAAHLRFEISPEWIAHLFREGEARGRGHVIRIARSVVREAEMLFAFAVLTRDRPELDNRPVELGKLNRNRAAKGKPELLDHLEVVLTLDAERGHAHGSGSARSSSRLHHVQGHMVRRAGKAFWRRSHLRGDLARPIASRTVTVK